MEIFTVLTTVDRQAHEKISHQSLNERARIVLNIHFDQFAAFQFNLQSQNVVELFIALRYLDTMRAVRILLSRKTISYSLSSNNHYRS